MTMNLEDVSERTRKRIQRRNFLSTARSGTRTRTAVRPRDFKSDPIQPFTTHPNHYQPSSQRVIHFLELTNIVFNWPVLSLAVPSVSPQI